jgi:dihydrofolate reductase
MRNLTLYMTMTLDGFFAGPNNELDWMIQTPDRELLADTVAFFNGFDEGLIGYPTGAGMIAYWGSVQDNPSASESEQAIAQAVNKLHPILVSTRSEALAVDHAELLVARDDAELIQAVTQIKERPGRDLGLTGGIRTAQKFIRLGLIDAYVFLVHPVALGTGKRMFTSPAALRLVSAKAYPSGIMRLCYQPRRGQ